MTNQRNSSQSNAILSTFSTSKKSLFSAIFFNKNQLNATRRNIGGYPATDQKAGDSNSPGRATKTRGNVDFRGFLFFYEHNNASYFKQAVKKYF